MVTLLHQNAMLARLSIGDFSDHKFDRNITNQVNAVYAASQNAGRYSKKLLPDGALDEIISIRGKARQTFNRRTSPWDAGFVRILPSVFYLDLVQEINEIRAEWLGAVENNFIPKYPSYILQREKELNGMFNPADYPSVDEVSRRFYFEMRVYPIPDSSDFRLTLGEDQMRHIREDTEESVKSALQDVTRDACSRIIEVVGKMAKKLNGFTPGVKGGDRAKDTFHHTLVDNVRDVVELLPAFNITKDPKFDALIKRIQVELCSEEAKTLRNNENVRKSVAKSAEEILAHVEQFM